MAHINLWTQGKTPFAPIQCGGNHKATLPKSRQIAAEYERGYYNLTKVLCPYDNPNTLSRLPISKTLEDVKVGDYIWLLLVPPFHSFIDAYVHIAPTLVPGSSMESVAGFDFDLVHTMINKPEGEEIEITNTIKKFVHGFVPSPYDSDFKDGYVVTSNVGYSVPVNKWYGVGLKINSLPDDKNLSEVTVNIGVGCHVIGYDTQNFA